MIIGGNEDEEAFFPASELNLTYYFFVVNYIILFNLAKISAYWMSLHPSNEEF